MAKRKVAIPNWTYVLERANHTVPTKAVMKAMNKLSTPTMIASTDIPSRYDAAADLTVYSPLFDSISYGGTLGSCSSIRIAVEYRNLDALLQ
jgi:hypothetical protein